MRENRANYSPEGWRQHVLALSRAKRQRLRRRQAGYRKKSREKHKKLLALGKGRPHESESSEYYAWRAMIARCHRPSSQYYNYYGARGIKVCKRWRESYANFLADMGRRPPGLELDRINNDGNYTPKNCRWTTTLENMSNRRCSRRLRFRGETKTLMEWATETGLGYAVIKDRVDKGWSAKSVLTVRLYGRNK